MTNFSRFLPWVVVGLAGMYLVSVLVPPAEPDNQMHLRDFGNLLVVDRGRVKPIDTFARVQLMLLNKRQDFRDEQDTTQPAVRWLLDVMASGLVDYYRIVMIHDPEVAAWLGLPERADRRYELEEVVAASSKKLGDLERIRKADPDKRTPTEMRAFHLVLQVADRYKTVSEMSHNLAKRGAENAKVFRIENDQVLHMLGLEPRSGLRYALSEFTGQKHEKTFREFLQTARQVEQRDEKQRDVVDAKVQELFGQLRVYFGLAQLGGVLMVPNPSAPHEDWKTLGQALLESDVAGRDYPAARSLEKMLRAYALDNAADFNREVAAHRETLAKLVPVATTKAGYETLFNHFEPFVQCMVLYVLVFLLACLSWVAFPQAFGRTAFWLGLLALAVHSLALVARMYIQGRPPVTNLYSSAVFIGWGCVLLCLALEWIFRNGFSIVVGSVLAFCTLLLAQHLAGSGDTLEMMQAVLDTNFWLATHVVCVTTGYTTTLVAGLFGAIYIILGVLTPALNRSLSKSIGQMMYGVVCFATLFSFVGTVLGGIWADQSWGRFWGWDPKENGALLIVIMNALVLHARWAGMVKERGMALLTLCGNIVTMWSWFGTNQLGVGLHAYGFNNTLAMVCTWTWVGHLTLIGLGSLPLRYWWSYRALTAPARPEFVKPGLKLQAGREARAVTAAR